MIEKDKLIVRILAGADGFFLPMRSADWPPPGPTTIFEHRTRFQSSGVPWNTGSGSETERKSQQRTLKSLSVDGLIEIFSHRRRLGVRLSERGDNFARALVGLPPVDFCHSLLCRIIDLESSADGLAPMTSELWLAGIENYGVADYQLKLWVLEDELLPALCRGWVSSNSDLHGRVYYSATALGRQIAQTPPPILPADLPQRNEEAWDLYFSERRGFREKLRSMKPDHTSEIGYIPLPCSIDLRPRKSLSMDCAETPVEVSENEQR